ncbi:hypothetical protein Tco_0307324 [Tanacetum coccineum]
MQKESVSKQGRKSVKAEPSVHKHPIFDELPEDTLDYMEIEVAQDGGRTREAVSTDRPNVSTDRPKVSTDKEKDSTVRTDEGRIKSFAIRNKPLTRTQLRNQMMTYLKHVGNKKHSDLKRKTFEEIQALYEKVKRFDESFTAVGSTEDERRIKEMNEGVKDTDQKKLKE